MANEESSLCNIFLEEADLKKISDLDPLHADGYYTFLRISIPLNIYFLDELGRETSDKQIVNIQILTKTNKSYYLAKEEGVLENIKVYITSEEDIFLNFTCNFNKAAYLQFCNKSQHNQSYSDFPEAMKNILQDCQEQGRTMRRAQFRINYEGNAIFTIFQQTQYRKLNILELNFNTSSPEKTHQSIIYRYNFNKSKLTMIEQAIEGIYEILAQKNEPLLNYIEKTVGSE